ncbi:MAG: AAA family ATPase [Prevotella sp.]|nr:AAA family ATPase [Prevotella sp.]
MNRTEERQKQNARQLLFADFSLPMDKVNAFFDDIERNPQKVGQYNQLLAKRISKDYEIIKEKGKEELKIMVKERTKEWSEHFGPVTMQEFATMSKQWDIPIGDVIDKKITPELIKELLDCFVIGQEEYKVQLSVAFYTYLMHGRQSGMSLPKSNLLVCGPSGSGKTFGMQVLCKLFHVPFVIIHCNSLVQEGIIGPGLTDGFTSLIVQGWTKDEVERAVVCFDEFDKLFEKKKGGYDAGYYNARVVNEMLNIIDDKGEVDFKEGFGRDDDSIKLPTRRMMFVFTGVFNGLRDKNTDKETLPKVKRQIGFLATEQVLKEDDLSLDKNPTEDDFIKFGVKPEIMGRIQNFVFLNELTEDEMVALLDLGASSPFNEFEQYFSSNDISSILTEEGKRTLAKIASEKKLGVRGLKSLLQRVLMEDMYDLDVGEDKILRVTKQYIMDNLK